MIFLPTIEIIFQEQKCIQMFEMSFPDRKCHELKDSHYNLTRMNLFLF